MNIEDQFGLEHLLFEQRKCKICGETKELIMIFIKLEKTGEMCHHHTHMSVRDVRLREFLREGESEKR